ncbi:hypothetical protein NMSP_1246 [Candidatus Nitrosomarinus catalina]|uniref:Uncharacterized protein n=1 Tax=Candidatus Nitrosomarinus catalinensis TaxID=1898749 RepID=A0A2Z2HLI6_9ARCH|nr:hypothetical protein [Candidatus Nitrosomarinus catalina]ARS64861.1 hypothetical protein NMSP_1246 [Candidatus Nitrosomarinus catalina]
MDYLSDDQIKILIISKESPTICDTLMEEDFDGRCLDRLIKNTSDFSYFSLCLTLMVNTIVKNKIQNIIKSKLGQDGLEELNSALNIYMHDAKNDVLAEQYTQEERDTANNESTDVFKYNTPEEDRDDWDYY